MVELAVGVVWIALSCLVGEPIGIVTEELYANHASNINWGTWIANATALVVTRRESNGDGDHDDRRDCGGFRGGIGGG